MAANAINRIFKNMGRCHGIISDQVWKDAPISRREKNIARA